ncbi:MAG: hypothetical protein WBV26_11415 [Candidatus Sulfotelmatobacter sp.]
MRWFRIIAIEVLVLSALGFAIGQTDQKPPETPEAKPSAHGTKADPASEPKPDPQIERLLRALGGTWSIKEKLAPDAASPRGATGEGKIVWRRGPGGFSVIEDYQSKQGSREITGLGVFWWDEAVQGYRTIWCDSTNPGGCINFKHVARWAGEQLILVEDYEINGKKFTFKEVFGNITLGAFTQTLYGGESSKELKVDQTIQATKLPGSAS